jgi:hypothetical protein
MAESRITSVFYHKQGPGDIIQGGFHSRFTVF